jgi:hypothetical protein
MRRRVYAFDTVRALIIGPWDNQKEADRANELRAMIDWFIDGKPIYVRPEREKGTRAILARLDPSNDEVWEFRSLKPRPSIRIFGTFIAKNVFIASNWAKRPALGAKNSEEWSDAIGQFKTVWEDCFSSFEPLHWSYPDDYLSHARFI